MNKKQLLAVVTCLVLGNFAFAQFKIALDPESQGKSMTLGKSGGTFEYFPWQALVLDCHMSPNLRFTVTELANGKASRMDCAKLKEETEKRRTEATAAREAAKKDAAAKLYIIYAQSSSGEWSKKHEAMTAEKARNAANRQCMDRKLPGVSPNTAARIVAPDGHEETMQCASRG